MSIEDRTTPQARPAKLSDNKVAYFDNPDITIQDQKTSQVITLNPSELAILLMLVRRIKDDI